MSFVFQPAEGPGMDHAVTVTLIMSAPLRGWFAEFSSSRLGAELCVPGEALAFPFFQRFASARHGLLSGVNQR